VTVQILIGDCLDVLRTLPDGMAQACVTSPPYFGLRDYGHAGQIGLEPTPDEFVAALVTVFREVRRVLRDDGTLWLNLGDSYNAAGRVGHGTRIGYKQSTNRASDSGADACRPSVAALKPKDLIGIPWRVAFALQADGWYLRQDIIWHKPNPMPESVTDRCTKAHEYVFLLSKSARYFYDAQAVAEPFADARMGASGAKTLPYSEGAGRRDTLSDGAKKGLGVSPGDTRNRRSVWTIATQPFSGAHFATMPPELAETCIKAGSKPGDMVLDPFGGAGTTGLAADRLQRDATLIELNPAYAAIARDRITGDAPLFGGAA
jgi:DNA modification methylase